MVKKESVIINGARTAIGRNGGAVVNLGIGTPTVFSLILAMRMPKMIVVGHQSGELGAISPKYIETMALVGNQC